MPPSDHHQLQRHETLHFSDSVTCLYLPHLLFLPLTELLIMPALPLKTLIFWPAVCCDFSNSWEWLPSLKWPQGEARTPGMLGCWIPPAPLPCPHPAQKPGGLFLPVQPLATSSLSDQLVCFVPIAVISPLHQSFWDSGQMLPYDPDSLTDFPPHWNRSRL